MRTATKGLFLFGALAAFVAVLGCASMAMAQVQVANNPSAAPTIQPATPVPIAAATMPDIALPAPAVHENPDDGDNDAKATASVKNVIKRLDKSVENVTAGDLNSARQAIARVDILIELEKKLAELDKVRSEKEEKSAAASIPASSLNPMGGGVPTIPQPTAYIPPQMPVMAMPAPSPSFTVSRISGAAGTYSAVLAMADGADKTVRVGDALSDNEKVVDIDSSGVIVDQKGARHQVRIKNVDRIFGSNP